MCSPTIFRSAGAGLYILGLLVAGVMFMIIGSEYNKSAPDNTDLKTYFWVYAISMVLAAIGLVLDHGNRFCGEEEFKGVDYFGGLFEVVAVFAWGALGVGIAHYYEDGTFNLLNANEERGALGWLSGVAAIFFGFGALFRLKQILCCEGFSCGMDTIFSFTNIVLQLALIVFWFLWANEMEDVGVCCAKAGDLRTYSYLIGIIYILMALLGALLFLEICCGGDDPKPPKPDYGYDDKPSYGDKPGYGGGYDDTTTGYGNQPGPAQY